MVKQKKPEKKHELGDKFNEILGWFKICKPRITENEAQLQFYFA